MSGGNNTIQDKDELENLRIAKIQAYAPIVQWVIGGFVTIIIAFGSLIYSQNTDLIRFQQELETERKTNDEQDKKIEETYKLMQNISSEQARIAESLENLSTNLTQAMERISRDTAEIRHRVDRHIESGHN